MRYEPARHSARRTDEYVFHSLIPYLGNKRHLLEPIGQALAATGLVPSRATLVDAFAGSGVVSRFAKRLGFAVVANDWEPYARVLNTAAIAVDHEPACASFGGYAAALHLLTSLPGVDGWVAQNLCPRDDQAPDAHRERLFYRRATGRRLDAVRDHLEALRRAGSIDDDTFACLLAPLLYQASWLANTSGVFKGFHAGWGGRNGTALHRILANLTLRPLRFLDNGRRHRVHTLDAAKLGEQLADHGPRADVVYLDPPYNQHPYASNYHVLNSLVLWDKPPLPPPTTRGQKAAIRSDWTERRSAFNHRHTALAAYRDLLRRFDAPFVITSYSTDGIIAVDDLVAANAEHGELTVFCRSYKRYRTSPTRPSPRPRNVEFVLLCRRAATARADEVAAVLAAIAEAAG